MKCHQCLNPNAKGLCEPTCENYDGRMERRYKPTIPTYVHSLTPGDGWRETPFTKADKERLINIEKMLKEILDGTKSSSD